MDVLTFGSPVMLKNLFNTIPAKGASGGRPVYEINLAVALAQLNINMDQFIDFCILSGCDYLETIPKIGPSMAFKVLLPSAGMYLYITFFS
jgi:flap endonuclease-1